MQTPSAVELMEAWDAGVRASPAERALLLLGTVRAESRSELSVMPLGWVTAQLLQLRAALLGPTLVCLASCRQCGTTLESTLEIAQLTALSPADATATGEPWSFSLQHDGYAIDFRLPSCADLLAVHGDPAAAAKRLALGLIERVVHREEALVLSDVPTELQAAIESAVLQRDPLSQIELSLSCPSCGAQAQETLHAIEFVWTEIAAWAERLLLEVARLAQAFGWREDDILHMSAQRRRRYLELLPS